MLRLCTLVLVTLTIAPAIADVPPPAPPRPPRGFTALFNGKDVSGWKGLVANPVKRREMSPEQLAAAQVKADERMRAHWSVEDGVLVFDGKGDSLCTASDYGDFELYVDWKIEAKGDSGIYLRGSPQLQIWDTENEAGRKHGAHLGSGALWNNQRSGNRPLVKADRPVGEWNTFRIRMIGSKVWCWLNGELTLDGVVMENYWERDKPIYRTGQIELQNHGNTLYFKNIFIREIGSEEAKCWLSDGWKSLFNGRDLTGWVGATDNYEVRDGAIVCKEGRGGNLYTADEYGDFVFRFEFQLPPGGNNGVGIRAPLQGDAAYAGMEIQVLDNTAKKYEELKPWQYHGSIYGLVAAHRGSLRPVGEWNHEEIRVEGSRVTVILNGTMIVDADVARITEPLSGREHPGRLRKRGHVGFCGHHDPVRFRRVAILPLD
ncbi:MAG: DUF1080 domain-containing protein [Planctomycetota bacterium]